ncbi:HEPN domain-containing protein [Thermodesulfobacteriota bacterium]
MTPQLEESHRLLRLAYRDRTAFEALLRAAGVDLAIACFHAQQAVEKALKAVLCLRDLEYPRTHDLEELSRRLVNDGLTPPVEDAALRRLTPYAVRFRYDDEPMHLLTGPEAEQIVEAVLAWAASFVGSGSAG